MNNKIYKTILNNFVLVVLFVAYLIFANSVNANLAEPCKACSGNVCVTIASGIHCTTSENLCSSP